jgi:hypothetical protein
MVPVSNDSSPITQRSIVVNRVREYFRLNLWAEVVSCLLSLIPVAGGYNWWSHEVTLMRLSIEIRLRIYNSWGNWGEEGFGWLDGNRRYPDDAVAIVDLYPI